MVGVVCQHFDYFTQGYNQYNYNYNYNPYQKDDWSDWVMVQQNVSAEELKKQDSLRLCTAMADIYTALMSVAPGQVRVSRFMSQVEPKISVLDYLKRIDKYFACSESVHVAALVYLDRLVSKNAIDLNPLTIHRLLAAATVVAVKFLDDIYYKNAYYAAVCGLSLKEMNKLEASFISLLGWKLAISEEDYALYCETVRQVLR